MSKRKLGESGQTRPVQKSEQLSPNQKSSADVYLTVVAIAVFLLLAVCSVFGVVFTTTFNNQSKQVDKPVFPTMQDGRLVDPAVAATPGVFLTVVTDYLYSHPELTHHEVYLTLQARFKAENPNVVNTFTPTSINMTPFYQTAVARATANFLQLPESVRNNCTPVFNSNGTHYCTFSSDFFKEFLKGYLGVK